MTDQTDDDKGADGAEDDEVDRGERTVVDLTAISPEARADEDEDDAAPGWSAAEAPARASDEQPIVLVDSGTFPPPRGALAAPDDVAPGSWPSPDDLESDQVLPPPELPGQPGAEAEAWTDLEIRTPPDELAAFARVRLEALVRTGQGERAARLDAAAQLALAAVRRAMGALPREDAP